MKPTTLGDYYEWRTRTHCPVEWHMNELINYDELKIKESRFMVTELVCPICDWHDKFIHVEKRRVI